MSHFTVLVIGDNVEEQLAPYQENNMGDCPREFIEFNDCTGKVDEEWENGTREMVVMPDGSYKSPWDAEFRVPGTIGTGTSTHEVPSHLEQREVPFKELYSSFEEFVEEWFGYDEYEGVYGYWHNPNSKWDWYSVGGRWSGFLKLKAGAEGVTGQPGVFDNKPKEGWCDQARKGDIDFEGMAQDTISEGLERRNKILAAIEGLPQLESWPSVRGRIEDIDEARKFYNSQPGIAAIREARLDPFLDCAVEVYHLGDPENGEADFINDMRCASLQTFAVVRDGQWYEKGEMRMFAYVFDEKTKYDWSAMFMSLIEDLPDDTLLTVVDCHI